MKKIGAQLIPTRFKENPAFWLIIFLVMMAAVACCCWQFLSVVIVTGDIAIAWIYLCCVLLILMAIIILAIVALYLARQIKHRNQTKNANLPPQA